MRRRITFKSICSLADQYHWGLSDHCRRFLTLPAARNRTHIGKKISRNERPWNQRAASAFRCYGIIAISQNSTTHSQSRRNSRRSRTARDYRYSRNDGSASYASGRQSASAISRIKVTSGRITGQAPAGITQAGAGGQTGSETGAFLGSRTAERCRSSHNRRTAGGIKSGAGGIALQCAGIETLGGAAFIVQESAVAGFACIQFAITAGSQGHRTLGGIESRTSAVAEQCAALEALGGASLAIQKRAVANLARIQLAIATGSRHCRAQGCIKAGASSIALQCPTLEALGHRADASASLAIQGIDRG